MKPRPIVRITESLFGRRTSRIGLALFLNALLASCGTSTAYAPGTNLTETPASLNDPIAEQLKAGVLLKWHDTTNEQKDTPAIGEYSKSYGKFSLSNAVVGFDPGDPDHKPIISEILVFEKGAYTVFYDQERKAISLSPTTVQYGKDVKTGNLTKSFAIITQDQEGKNVETPYLSYVSNTKYDNNIRELIRKAVEGKNEEERNAAIKQLDSNLFDKPTEQIGEVIYNNLATGEGVDLIKKDNPNWFKQIGDFLASVNPFKVISAQAQGLSSAEETAQALTSAPPTAIPPTEVAPTATSTSTPEATINLPIVLKYEVGKFDSLPSISQEDAVSPAFDAFLNQQEAAGNLNDFPDDRYLEGYGFGSDKWIPQRNPATPASIVEIENANYTNGTFADNLRRPIVEQAYFRTQINNADYLLIISKFHNNDGSEVRIKIVVPKNKAEQYWEGYFNPTNMNKITLPKQWPDNADPNISPLAHDANYYLNYWKIHQTQMKALIDGMINGNMQFPPEFANFLWEAQTMSTRPK